MRKEDSRCASRRVSTSQLRDHWRMNLPFRLSRTSARGCPRRSESHSSQTKIGRLKCRLVSLNFYEHQKPLASAVGLVMKHLPGVGLPVVPQSLQIQ